MRYRFFTIPIHDGEAAAAELNRCLAEARILAVDRQFVADGANSAWAVCVLSQGVGQRLREIWEMQVRAVGAGHRGSVAG